MERLKKWTGKDKREAIYNSCPARWKRKINGDSTFDIWTANEQQVLDFLTALYNNDKGDGTLNRLKVQMENTARNAAAESRRKPNEKRAKKNGGYQGRQGNYQQF